MPTERLIMADAAGESVKRTSNKKRRKRKKRKSAAGGPAEAASAITSSPGNDAPPAAADASMAGPSGDDAHESTDKHELVGEDAARGQGSANMSAAEAPASSGVAVAAAAEGREGPEKHSAGGGAEEKPEVSPDDASEELGAGHSASEGKDGSGVPAQTGAANCSSDEPREATAAVAQSQVAPPPPVPTISGAAAPPGSPAPPPLPSIAASGRGARDELQRQIRAKLAATAATAATPHQAGPDDAAAVGKADKTPIKDASGAREGSLGATQGEDSASGDDDALKRQIRAKLAAASLSASQDAASSDAAAAVGSSGDKSAQGVPVTGERSLSATLTTAAPASPVSHVRALIAERDDLLGANRTLLETVEALRGEISSQRGAANRQDDRIARLESALVEERERADAALAAVHSIGSRTPAPRDDAEHGASPSKDDAASTRGIERSRALSDELHGGSMYSGYESAGDGAAIAQLEAELRAKDKALRLKDREIADLRDKVSATSEMLSAAHRHGGALAAQVAKLQDWRTKLEKDVSRARQKVSQLTMLCEESATELEGARAVQAELDVTRQRHAKLQLRYTVLQKQFRALQHSLEGDLHGASSAVAVVSDNDDFDDIDAIDGVDIGASRTRYTTPGDRLKPGTSSLRRGTFFGAVSAVQAVSTAKRSRRVASPLDKLPHSAVVRAKASAPGDGAGSSHRSAQEKRGKGHGKRAGDRDGAHADVFHSPIQSSGAQRHHRRRHRRDGTRADSGEKNLTAELSEQILLRVHAERTRQTAVRELKQVRATAKRLETEVAGLREQVTSWRDRCGALEQRVDTMEGVTRRARAKIEALQTQREQLQTQLKTEQSHRKSVDENAKKVVELSERVDKLTADLQAARSRYSVLHIRERRKAREGALASRHVASADSGFEARQSRDGGRARSVSPGRAPGRQRLRSASPARGRSPSQPADDALAMAASRALASRTGAGGTAAHERLRSSRSSQRRGTYFGTYTPGTAAARAPGGRNDGAAQSRPERQGRRSRSVSPHMRRRDVSIKSSAGANATRLGNGDSVEHRHGSAAASGFDDTGRTSIPTITEEGDEDAES